MIITVWLLLYLLPEDTNPTEIKAYYPEKAMCMDVKKHAYSPPDWTCIEMESLDLNGKGNILLVNPKHWS